MVVQACNNMKQQTFKLIVCLLKLFLSLVLGHNTYVRHTCRFILSQQGYIHKAKAQI